MTKQKIYGLIGGNTLATNFGFDEENENFKKFKEFATNFISTLDGKILTCANAGLELWCGEIAVECQKPLLCVMPYEEQATKWCNDHRERFFNLHEKAENVEILSKKYYYTCEEDAKIYVAKNCDCLIIVKSKSNGLCENNLAEIMENKEVIVLDCDEFTIKNKI